MRMLLDRVVNSQWFVGRRTRQSIPGVVPSHLSNGEVCSTEKEACSMERLCSVREEGIGCGYAR